MNFSKLATALSLAVGAIAAPVQAAPILLDFEGIGSQVAINDFYNGGTDAAGNSGVNYGVHFGSNALGVVEQDPAANFSGEPTPNTIMFFLTGTAVLNYAPGFDTGFSFWYTTVGFTGNVKIYDGLDATGNLLGTINLPALGAGPDPANTFSNWAVGALAFAGSAKSIDFGGTVNQIGFDNITFGSIDPNRVPEPTTLALAAFALLAGAGATRRRNA